MYLFVFVLYIYWLFTAAFEYLRYLMCSAAALFPCNG